MHVSGHMGGLSGVHHGVPLAANGSHMMLDSSLDVDFYHDQDSHDMNERLINNFRPNQMPNFNVSRM